MTAIASAVCAGTLAGFLRFDELLVRVGILDLSLRVSVVYSVPGGSRTKRLVANKTPKGSLRGALTEAGYSS